jgi:hypothetical protein
MQEQISDNQRARDDAEHASSAQPEPREREAVPTHTQPTRGHLGDFLHAVNRPYLLITLPVLLGGVWLISHPELITDNLNKPYALLAGPVLVGSLLTGWLIFKFFRTIETWCIMAWKAFFRAQKEDSSAQFFWTVIVVFMVVSVFASGSFFTNLEHDVIPGLGYVTALFIDLVAVQAMRARLNAVRMRDKRGEGLYLFGVFVCSGASAFANVYTSLADFNQHITGVLPPWMLNIAPWFGLVFPALILLLSITADYTLDQTSTKLDPENYRRQEEKRIKLIEIQRDMLRRRVTIEQEIDHLSGQLKAGKQERVFFLIHWFFPRKQPDTQQIVAEAVKQLRAIYDPQLQQFADYIQQALGVNLFASNEQIAPASSPVLAPHAEFSPHENEGQSPAKEGQKSLTFTPNMFHQKALKFIQHHTEWRSQFEAILRDDPRHGFDQIAAFVRRQPGMNYDFVTAQFIGEVLSLLQLTEEQNTAATRRRETASVSPGETHQLSLAAQNASADNEAVNAVNPLHKRGEASETAVNVLHGGETGYAPGGVQTPRSLPSSHPSLAAKGVSVERITDPQQSAISVMERVSGSPEIGRESHVGFDANVARNDLAMAHDLPTNFSGNEQTIPAANRARITRKLDGLVAPDSAAVRHQIEESDKVNREPYVCTIAEAAERKRCTVKVIEDAITAGQIRRPKRGDGSKVLISSLDEWTPPRRRRRS